MALTLVPSRILELLLHLQEEAALCSAECRDQEIMIEEEAKNKIAIRCSSYSSLPAGGWNRQQRRTWTWLVLNNVESHMWLTGSGNISGIPVQCSCSSFAYLTSSSPSGYDGRRYRKCSCCCKLFA
ncbi:uncharacterized protein LOC119292826 [Triticum dicoccoides]|uniref:uncharacterized protein LOC119292826 n=1 Tax=Triticum dicoccoides TaxID=85692 RepID=UPI00188E7317|nr:uncharacterized protein LOC119292826 [Triticum dicoccoides]